MKQCFVSVGLAKDEKGEFTKYTNHRKGKLATPIKKVDTDEHTVTFGEVVAEVEVLRRDGADSDDEGEEPEAEEEGEDNDDEDGDDDDE